MKPAITIISTLFSLLSIRPVYSQSSSLQLKKATNHPIQYLLSLPDNWSVNTKWPVVIVVSDAEKQFGKDAEQFIGARKGLPFIIVTPFTTTNGTKGQKDPIIYPYSESVWDTIDKLTICKFDMDGLQSIIKDVQKSYSGSDKVFITGFEAGAHLVWAMIFNHPELLYAAAPVAGNFRNRCIETNSFSNDPSRTQLLINNFTGSDDQDFGQKGRIYSQYLKAKALARSHGYNNLSETEVQGKGHVPLPADVLNYFNTVWESIKK
jgi:predicted peptidase